MYQIVIRSYTFCATVTRILQKVPFSINFDLDLMVMGPAGPFNEQQTGLDILCQISLSIKFPCVLLQVLMRSRLPCQFLDLWDSVLPLVKWPLQCRHELMKRIQGGVHRSVLHSDGWPQPNDTFWYVLHNPSVCPEQWHSFTCVLWKLPLSSYAFCLAFWWMALANRYVLIRSVQPFRAFWNLKLFFPTVFCKHH